MSTAHTTDFDLTSKHVSNLTSPDAFAAFFSSLGYDTSLRSLLTSESIGLTGDSAAAVKHIELLSEDADGFLRVVFVQLRSLTAKSRNDLARVLGKANVDHLLVLTSDFSTLEFVLLDKRRREVHGPARGTAIQTVPLTIAVERKSPATKELRALRRFTWNKRDGLEQFDKLRNVFSAAAFTEEYFCNRALFADHYLLTRLREDPAWRENPTQAFHAVRDFCRDASERWKEKGEQVARQELYEPLFDLLSFDATINKQPGDGQIKPDYLLAGKSGNTKTAAFVYAWDRWLDGPDHNLDKETPDENPGACVVSALEEGIADWIVVTNGRQWRLYSKSAHSRATNFYEVDLVEAIFASGDTDPNEAFRYWWLFFRAEAFAPRGDGQAGCWLDTIAEGSRDYAKELGERLKDRVFVTIFPYLAQGFLTDRRQRLGLKKQATEDELRDVYEGTLTLLYRLLFLLYAEARDLLPIREGPYREASFRKIKDEIAGKAGIAESEVGEHINKAYSANEHALYDRLMRLCAAMDNGDPALNVPIYNGGLFITQPGDSEDREQRIARFLAEHKVPDRFLAMAIDRLARDPDDKTYSLVAIDYKSLEVRHLGSIYEGLLEFKLKVAEVDLTTHTEKKREKYIPLGKAKPKRGKAPIAVVHKGDVYLSNDKAERKASGSYYTPDPIVEHIVEHTVGPVLEEKLEKLRPEFRKVRKTFDNELAKLRVPPAPEEVRTGKMTDREFAGEKTYKTHQPLVEELFDFRVLDPAMGSGHFLVEAVDRITDWLLAFLNQFPINPVAFMLDRTRKNIMEALGQQGVSVDPDKLTEVNLLKRHVLKRCIYGVDLNPMAAELAKVSLWLDAFTIGAPLSFLDHHLRCGNSLIGATFKDLEAATKGQLFGVDYEPLLRAIRHVLHVNAMADATAAEVKQSATEYGQARDQLAGYQIVLDLLVAKHFGVSDASELLTRGGSELRLNSRTDFMQMLADLNELATVEKVEQVAAQPQLRFFHWEIEFPEVFFGFTDTEQRQIKHKNEIADGVAGFDAVVGNPPYDVLAEKELGVDLSELQAYIKSMAIYAPAISGKQNLYKLFICRNVRLVRHAGRVGHIVPMALLGDEQSVGVRKMLLGETALRVVEAFPQKDDATIRVFEDAKLSTCVFVTSRSIDDQPFLSRIHPGKNILITSPSQSIRRSDVALYDPENQPIVACSQEDWDLATRIMRSGRMARLGEYCRAFQGEVNETIDGGKGNLSESPADGPQVLRGSNICLYVLRPPSQGEAIYLRRDKYLKDKNSTAKAWHHKHIRVGLQESCPQNNFRRIIASLIPAGEFCNHVINYFPEPQSKYPLPILLAVLNSKLADWYFRLGSTNAHVSHYQLYNLPAPVFSTDTPDASIVGEFSRLVAESDVATAFDTIADLLVAPPFPVTVCDCIVIAVKRIIAIERDRGDIARAKRSSLDSAAQPIQDLLDRIIYRMAGLTDKEATELERRLVKML